MRDRSRVHDVGVGRDVVDGGNSVFSRSGLAGDQAARKPTLTDVTKKEGNFDLQSFHGRLNVRKFEEDSRVRDTLIIKHEADAPDYRREADILGAGQVIQNNVVGIRSHVELQVDKNSDQGVKCSS